MMSRSCFRAPVFNRLCFAVALSFAVLPVARAEVKLPGFFGDHMVLQAEKDLHIWGWANPSESVSVSIEQLETTSVRTTTAGPDGKWKVTFPPIQASTQPAEVVVKGKKNAVMLTDVLFGEVWLCSGQSNMEWTVRQSSSSKDEIAAANYPLIRHMKVAHRPSTTALVNIESTWQKCSPETAGNFTACGYFMARHLHKELNVPIGLINSSWGGTRVEPWTPPVGFEKVDALDDIHTAVLNRTPGTKQNKLLMTKYVAAVESWLGNAKSVLANGETISPIPAYPTSLAPFKSHQDPTMLYNGMIHALVGLSFRGAIWYQGESNHVEGSLYTEKKKALINGWRELWGQGDFPFYYVQIAPFQYGKESPSILANFWEAQAAVQQVPNTAMVVINDIATVNNIHPPNKQDVGRRLALLALKNDYGKDVVASSPEFESIELLGDKLKVNFKNTGGGLTTRDGKPPTHFELVGSGSDGFKEAIAIIDGDAVLLRSDNVAKPTAMRFAWHKLAEPNLAGGTGLPVGAFRAGKEPDLMGQLKIDDGFRLVYEMDLSQLKKDFSYRIDNSQTVGSFDTIGYLVGLRSKAYGTQVVFVTMDAFTDDPKKIGIPTAASGANFRQNVTNMQVYSTNAALQTDPGVTGNIEFWPNNYGPQNQFNVPSASNNKYDFGDMPAPPVDGYGSMQVHNFAAKQTVFSINHWNTGASADIGIGNSPSEHPDWTFTGNASTYEQKHFRVYVK